MKSSSTKTIFRFISDENSILSKIVNWIISFSTKIDKIPGKKMELIACCLYTLFHFIMLIYHEPWYDEAVAWNIARSATIKDILFSIPHYEGHPPLWHLVLLPWARLGISYELSLSIISFLFAGSACFLIIYKAPFPRILRVLLPFTYFFFYQYGVISRPYCMMMLAFVLLAIHYPKHNEQPWKYVFLLSFLCLTSAYGIVLAGGLTIAWILEMWNKQKINVFLKNIVKDRRFLCLWFLLIFALLLIWEFFPAEDTFATVYRTRKKENNLITCFLYMFLASPLDVTFASVFNGGAPIQYSGLFPPLFISACILGILVWNVAFIFGKQKGTFLELGIPYLLFSIFAGIVYISRHHIGICLLFILFWLWITVESKKTIKTAYKSNSIIVKNCVVVFLAISFITSLYWSAYATFQDIKSSYAFGRYESQFIKEHNLTQYNIMISWDTTNSNVDINHTRADNYAPYFEHNIFFNFNEGRDDVNYSTHKTASESYTQECMEKWREQGLPEVLVLRPDTLSVYDIEIENAYTLVYKQSINMVWKGFPSKSRSEIWVRNDMCEILGLEEIQG